jgi:hypothetical protein
MIKMSNRQGASLELEIRPAAVLPRDCQCKGLFSKVEQWCQSSMLIAQQRFLSEAPQRILKNTKALLRSDNCGISRKSRAVKTLRSEINHRSQPLRCKQGLCRIA